jgi:hypothetical protein
MLVQVGPEVGSGVVSTGGSDVGSTVGSGVVIIGSPVGSPVGSGHGTVMVDPGTSAGGGLAARQVQTSKDVSIRSHCRQESILTAAVFCETPRATLRPQALITQLIAAALI